MIFVEFCFDGDIVSGFVWVCGQIEVCVCGEQYGVQEFLDICVGVSGDVDEYYVVIEFFSDQIVFGELLMDF